MGDTQSRLLTYSLSLTITLDHTNQYRPPSAFKSPFLFLSLDLLLASFVWELDDSLKKGVISLV